MCSSPSPRAVFLPTIMPHPLMFRAEDMPVHLCENQSSSMVYCFSCQPPCHQGRYCNYRTGLCAGLLLQGPLPSLPCRGSLQWLLSEETGTVRSDERGDVQARGVPSDYHGLLSSSASPPLFEQTQGLNARDLSEVHLLQRRGSRVAARRLKPPYSMPLWPPELSCIYCFCSAPGSQRGEGPAY